ncbi:MAG: hypothetical protein IT429_14945 [Gemmataceae bacterium]|nr:hypothetical protein [Gemmataceae bacterium]
MSADRLALYLASLPDAELADAVRRAVVSLLLTPPGLEHDRELCQGIYGSSWFAAVETGREGVWRHAVAQGREDVRAQDRENYRRTREARG